MDVDAVEIFFICMQLGIFFFRSLSHDRSGSLASHSFFSAKFFIVCKVRGQDETRLVGDSHNSVD